MKRHLFLMLGVLVVIIVNALAFAQKHPKSQSLFKINKANAQYEVIKKKLNVINTLVPLNKNVDQLENLHNRAQECVEGAGSHLKLINDLLKTTQFDESAPVQRADYEYLQNKKVFYTKELSQCRLFVYRSQELMVDYRDKIQRLSTYKILQQSNPVWEINFISGVKSFTKFDFKKIYSESGLDKLTTNEYMIGLALLVIAVLTGIYMRLLSRSWFANTMQVHVMLRAVFAVLQSVVLPLMVFAILSSFLNAIYDGLPTMPTVELISHAILIYFLAYTASRYLFYPSASVSNLLKLPVWFGYLLHRRFMLFNTMLLVSYIVYLFFMGQPLSEGAFELARIMFVTALSIFTLWFCLAFFVYAKKENKTSIFISSVQACLWALFFVSVIAEWLGYHRLVIYVVSGVLLTVLSTLAAVGIWRLVDAIYESFDDRQYRIARKLHVIFGVKFNKHLYEFGLIKFSLYAAILFYYLVSIMHVWQVSENWIDRLTNWIFEGFHIVNFHIVPARLIVAILTFAVIFLIGRFVAAIVAKKADFQGEEDTQIAVSTVIIYAAFAGALLCALLVTGVDFTGLAIIAGALSVGIGLGLQNIVNNFVSGLILLLEKPIKPGDRVVVGTTEGFVKRIRIRSTQIATLAKEDVIVPNADLITNKVTNYMFRDRHWRITCKVGVAYGSDVELVKRVLMEVAYANDDVVHDAPNEPIVLFRDFSDSCLTFELWCVIYDVNKKYLAVSDLNFAIDDAFRKNNITIAFPQRDLHIKDYQTIKGKLESAK